jgi:hypothetical protein
MCTFGVSSNETRRARRQVKGSRGQEGCANVEDHARVTSRQCLISADVPGARTQVSDRPLLYTVTAMRHADTLGLHTTFIFTLELKHVFVTAQVSRKPLG